MFAEKITERLVQTPEATVGAEGMEIVANWRASKAWKGTAVPDLVLDAVGNQIIQIPGIGEHGEQVADIINVLSSSKEADKPLANAFRHLIEHRKTLGEIMVARDLSRFATCEFLKAGLMGCAKTFFRSGMAYAVKRQMGFAHGPGKDRKTKSCLASMVP